MSTFLSIILIIIGFILIVKGAEFLVNGSSNIARKIHIPQIVIGLTIVSIGTSLPELFVSVSSALKGYTDMQIGNVLGSNIYNLILILGICASIKTIKVKRETRLIEIPMCLILTIIFVLFCNTHYGISKEEALILLVLFIMFIMYTIIMGIKGEKFDKEDDDGNEEKEEIKQLSIFKSIMYISLGIIGLKFGGDFIVENAVVIGQKLNISEKILSLTILAIGTSLPELVTCIIAAIKGNSDISIGNIIGSNIFNMTLIIGVSSLINPIKFNIEYNIEIIILLLANISLMLFSVLPPKNRINREKGILYLILYLVYIVILFNR